MPRRFDPSLQLTTTDNPAFSVSITIGDDRGFQQYRQGDPLFSPQSFLLVHPPGPYTCLRTVKNRSIAMLSFHLKRLRESAEATGMENSVRQEGRHSLEKRTVDAISKTMEAFLAANTPRDQACPECMVTVLYVQQAGDGYVENSCPGSPQPLKILAHAWPLFPTAPDYEGPGVEVLVAGSRRSRPEAKHSSWLRDREHLDKLKVKAGAKEVVLWEVDTSREGIERRVLLEGLTSNVFVVEDGTLHTATTGILLGGMRQLCIESCTEKGFSVSLEPPEVSRAQWWQAAFLTGTGRILEPISAFLLDEDMASAMLGSKRQISSTVMHREPLIARENGVSTNGVDKSPDYGGNNIANPPLWRFGVMGDEEGKSLVRSVRRNMVSALESSATRLL